MAAQLEPPASMPHVEAESVSRVFRSGAQPVYALQDINLVVEKGTFVVLRGRSGSGKTTLLNIIGGLDRPSDGKVLVGGRDLRRFGDRALTKWRRTEVGFIFQAFGLIQVLTALENVEVGLSISGVRGAKRRARALECLERVGLAKRAGHRVHELSGGEQQRVCIARALANRPTMIIADEPTGELDQTTGIGVLTLFRHLVEEGGVTICMATHDPQAAAFGDIVYDLVDGKIVEGEPSK